MAIVPTDVKSGHDFRDFQEGQGALEYLLLIGGAIVVAAVVIALILQVSGSSGGSAKSSVYQFQIKTLIATRSVEGYWKFDEASGTVANDSSGKGRNATLTYGPTWTSGKYAGGLTTGTNSWVSLPAASPIDLSSKSYTIAAWFMYPLAGSGWHRLVSGTQIPVMVDSAYALGTYLPTGSPPGFQSTTYEMDNPPLSNGWHHIAAVANGTTTTFYIDGQKVGNPVTAAGGTMNTVGNLDGGGQQWGTFDEVIVINRPLSEQEVKALANG